jgi:hypothetical protein
MTMHYVPGKIDDAIDRGFDPHQSHETPQRVLDEIDVQRAAGIDPLTAFAEAVDVTRAEVRDREIAEGLEDMHRARERDAEWWSE